MVSLPFLKFKEEIFNLNLIQHQGKGKGKSRSTTNQTQPSIRNVLVPGDY